MSDTQLSTLVINKLTKAQYEGTTPSNQELYFITDEDAYLSSDQGSVNEGKVLTVGSDGIVTPQDPTGISDYTQLLNKPEINGNVLTGNKTASQLGFATVSTSGSYTDLIDKPNLATVATSGSYNDLSNKPTIPAAQQQVDWNASSGITSIANKPTLSAVATSGDYTDLSNKPTINDLTTSAQLAALNSGATSTNIAQITTNQTDISTINGKIPSAASTSNQLADKAFVNSSISNMAANYVTSDAQGDNFATKAALLAGPYYYKGQSYTLTNNDYALVESDETKNNATTRYMYDGVQWNFQYIVNNAPFNQAQLDAINSTITSNLVTSYSNHVADTDIHVTAAQKTAWTAKQDALVSGTNIKTINSQSILGSGDLAVDTLPSQSGKNGKYLTTDGTDPSWADIPTELPSQSGQSGKFLTTDGTDASWTSLSASDIPNLTLSKITDVTATATEVNVLDGITASTSELNILDGVTASTAEINTLNGITATTTELNYVGGVTSSIQTQLDNKVAKNNSTQAKAYGTTSGGVETTWKIASSASASSLAYRGTDGVLAVGTPTLNEHAATKAYVDAVIPSQSGNSGKYLTTNGTTVSWATVNALPSQSGNAGKYLTTNGTTASWIAIEEYTANEVETLWNSI